MARDVRISGFPGGRPRGWPDDFVPLAWFPRLVNGTPAERGHWRFIENAEGIHWPELDEDISIESLLAGRGPSETQASFRRWLQGRNSLA